MAFEIFAARYNSHELTTNSLAAARQYLRIKLDAFEHEVFGVLFVDLNHRLTDDVLMFGGTIDQASVYPREVAKISAKTELCSHRDVP